MSYYAAITNGSEIKTGMALCVRSGSLRADDVLAIETATGVKIEALVERSALSELELSIGRKTVKCRPWSRGDSMLCRNAGTSSNWTVADVLEAQVA
jgi:molybdopterin-binding protein